MFFLEIFLACYYNITPIALDQWAMGQIMRTNRKNEAEKQQTHLKTKGKEFNCEKNSYLKGATNRCIINYLIKHFVF